MPKSKSKSKSNENVNMNVFLGALYFFSYNQIIQDVVLLISVSLLIYFIFTKWDTITQTVTEKMTNLFPSNYPLENKGVLLDYPLQNNPSHLSKDNALQAYQKYYMAYNVPMSSYEQITNNELLKNIKTPCDGTTSPIDMCGGLYGIPKEKKTTFPNCHGVRVNLYDSCN